MGIAAVERESLGSNRGRLSGSGVRVEAFSVALRRSPTVARVASVTSVAAGFQIESLRNVYCIILVMEKTTTGTGHAGLDWLAGQEPQTVDLLVEADGTTVPL